MAGNGARAGCSGCVVAFVAIVLLAIAVAPRIPGILQPTPPTHAETRREEVRAQDQAVLDHQQAELDRAWMPWKTGAENLALIGFCLIIPVAGGVTVYAVLRKVR